MCIHSVTMYSLFNIQVLLYTMFRLMVIMYVQLWMRSAQHNAPVLSTLQIPQHINGKCAVLNSWCIGIFGQFTAYVMSGLHIVDK